ncbi:Programmed cell death protein 2 [Euphorbia peplus]|nr:Programmed cell death protein 2 [Euphorbia peplus]
MQKLDDNNDGDSIENLKGLHISEVEQEMLGEEVDDDDDEDENEQEPVTLGFVEKPKNYWSLLPHLFPSKAGGVPAWLDPVNLPSGRSCVCDICGEPLQFLLQVYAPISEKESTFHRTLFLFMCPSMPCILRDQHEQWKRKPQIPSRSVKVFRCQLPRSNPYYPSAPPRHDGTDKPCKSGVVVCKWCGTWKGDKVCSTCKDAQYCSQKHQIMHWRAGHRTDCQQQITASGLPDSDPSDQGANLGSVIKFACKTLWPEYEVINEDESEFDDEISDNGGHDSSLVPRNKVDDTMKLMDSFEGDGDKKCWTSFQSCIAKAPDQVLRYCRSDNAKPIWPSTSGQLSTADIPSCSYCGGPMTYEFQVLPQLLYYFGVKNDVDSLDWATIVVYTCVASCEGSVSYKEEYAWVQL